MVKLLELLAPIEMDGDQSLNILGLQAADHLVVVVLDAKHAIDFVLRRRRGGRGARLRRIFSSV